MEKQVFFSVRSVRQSNHERIVILMRSDTGFPVELVARYVATELLERESENTTRSRLYAIKAFYEWALTIIDEPFDPDTRLCEPDALDLKSVKSFAQYLRLRRQHDFTTVTRSRNLPTFERVIIGNHTVAQYLIFVSSFAVWAAQTQARPLMSANRIQELKKWFANETRAFRKTCRRMDRALSVEQQNKLRAVVSPDSCENPYNLPVRYRNQAIIHLLLNAPLRRGELLGLRLEDLNLTGTSCYSVTVVVQHHDKASLTVDPRLVRPRQKTNGREIPITKETKDKIIAYMRIERPARSRSPFLFLGSRNGSPLSLNAVNYIFSTLSKSLTADFPKLHPHLLRHTFNYNFKIHNLDKKLNFDQARQVQNHLNGWTDRSSQADAYGSAANVIIADHYVSEMHAQILTESRA